MKHEDLRKHDTYVYEVKEWGVLYGDFPKYDDAVEKAKYLYGAGHTHVVVISKKFNEFDLTTSEDIKKLVDDDLLTFEVDALEYEASLGSSETIKKLGALMNKYEIASFKLDLKDFKLKDGVQFAKPR